MLVLARFVKRLLQEGGLDYRCVFLLSAQDEQLLGNPPKVVLPSGRRFSQPLMLTTPDGELEIPAGDLHGLFVAEFPFQPERGESDTPWFERSLTMRLVPGDWYWVLIEGAFGRLEPGIRNYATIDLNVKNVQVLVVHAGGLYPRLDPGEYSDACSAREQVTPGRAGLDPFARIMADRAAAGIDTGLPVTQEEVDWLVRAAGAVLGFPVSGDILAAGRELAASPVRPMLEAGLRRLYALWSASTGSEGLLRSRLREQVRKRQRSGSGSVLLGQPTVEIAVDLSNPGEFGASGPALLVDFAAQPYAMVGISDAPGSGPLREGSGVSLMLPFWACDLLAQALYPLPEPEREPLAQWRAAAVAAQSFRHLENRNVRAFVLHDPRGRPVDSGGRFEFDHTGEVRFESPAGSTVFAEPVVQVAMRRRAQETMRLQVHADAIAFFGDAGWPNPWPALAGFLGVKMYPLVTLQGPEGREAAIASVARPAMHPRQIEEPGTGTESFRFLTLTHRHDVEEQIARHVMAQDRLAREPRLDTGTGEPGILELPVPEIWRPGLVLQQQQNVLTPSQAEAWRMLARWPMAVTTGGPGAGKTHFTRVLVHGLRELSNDSVWVMLLAPTNRAAARLAERVAPAARQGEPLLLGGRAERGTVKGPPNLIVGTVDAFIARFRNSRSFADALVTRDGVLVFDESGMLTMDRVAMVLELLDPPAALRSPTHTGRLLRTVFTGDTHQLGSVEPGDFLGDMQRFLPLVHLREAVRVMSGKDESPLGSIFSLVRAGLEDQNWRQAFVRWSLAHTPAGASVIARDQAALTRFRLPAPDNTPKSVFRVLMVDDLPERKPASDEDYSRWLVGAEERLRNTVFRAILQFRKVKLTTVNLDAQDPGAPIVPSAPLTATREQQNAVLVDYERMRLAFTRREPPFKVITLYRVPRSSSSQTVFFSSAERVNGWFHDFLTGRLPPPPGHWMPRVAEFAEDRVRADVDYSATLYAQEQGPEHSGPATLRFLAERRPHDLALVPNWPYIVKRNDFRQFGIFRGETIWHTGRIASRGETMCRFVSEVGAEMVVPVRFAQPRYLGYGWATNVHQVQGGEYPLVIMLWLEGVPWSGDNGLAAAWEELSPGMTAAEKVARAMQPLRTGDGQGDDRMGLDKFYTGITRTMAGWSLPVPDPETGEPRTQGSGQCVVVAGWYALRLYPGLSVQRRATGFAGTVRDMLDERP